MHRATRLKITELNPHLICILCGGYLIDATTIVECLHSFCRTCVVRYLDTSKYCPICDVLVHKTKPLLNIRLDHTLQDLVYKLVPGLFKEEMKRRRDFYKDRLTKDEDAKTGDPHTSCGQRRHHDGAPERVIYSDDEEISLALELSVDGRPPAKSITDDSYFGQRKQPADRRFLKCPAAVTIDHLKKFIRMKFSLSDRYQIDVYHTDEILKEHYTLMDVAYIYLWRRRGPLRLFYTVYTNAAKRFKTVGSMTSETVTSSAMTPPTTESQATPSSLPQLPAPVKIPTQETTVLNPVKQSVSSCGQTVGHSSHPVMMTPLKIPDYKYPSDINTPKSPLKNCVDKCVSTDENASEKQQKSRECPKSEITTPNGATKTGLPTLTNKPDKEQKHHYRVPIYNKTVGSHLNSHHTNGFSNITDAKTSLKNNDTKSSVEKRSYSEVKTSSKQNGLLSNGEVDKYAFTDEDDEIPICASRFHFVKHDQAKVHY